MKELLYQQLKKLEDKRQYFERQKAQAEANKAYNKGLWDSVKWRNPLAYLVLKRFE